MSTYKVNHAASIYRETAVGTLDLLDWMQTKNTWTVHSYLLHLCFVLALTAFLRRCNLTHGVARFPMKFRRLYITRAQYYCAQSLLDPCLCGFALSSPLHPPSLLLVSAAPGAASLGVEPDWVGQTVISDVHSFVIIAPLMSSPLLLFHMLKPINCCICYHASPLLSNFEHWCQLAGPAPASPGDAVKSAVLGITAH